MKKGGGRRKGSAYWLGKTLPESMCRRISQTVKENARRQYLLNPEYVLDEGKRKLVYSHHWRRCIRRSCLRCKKPVYVPVSLLPTEHLEYRFCSIVCRNKFLVHAGSENGNWRGGSPVRKCIVCKNDFTPERSAVRRGFGRYCSLSCFAGRKRLVVYGMSRFKSSWELAFALWLRKQGLHYRYEPRTFDVGWFSYTPDFYVIEWKMYVEIKGMLTNAYQEKFDSFQKTYPSIEIMMLRGRHLLSLGLNI